MSVTGERAALGEGDISKSDVKSRGPLPSGSPGIIQLALSVVSSSVGSQGQSTGQEQNNRLHIFLPSSVLRLYGTASRSEKSLAFCSILHILQKKKSLAIAVTQFECD